MSLASFWPGFICNLHLSIYVFFPEQVCYIDETHVSWNVQICSWSSRCQLSTVISTHTFPSSCCRTLHADAQSPPSAQCELFVHFVPAFFEVRIFACGDCVRHIVLLKYCNFAGLGLMSKDFSPHCMRRVCFPNLLPILGPNSYTNFKMVTGTI